MNLAFGKYAHVFGLGIQNTLVYRVNFLFRATFGLVPLAGNLFIWQAIYAGHPAGTVLGGYSLAQMISYYLLVTLIDAVTAVAEDDWQIAADIKDGQVSQFLLKPMDYLAYRLCLYGSGRAVYTTMALIPVVVFILFQREHFVLPSDPGTVLLAAASIVFAGILQFLIAFSVALLAFWVLDVSTFIFIQFAFEYIASGHLFPLDILPPLLHRIVMLTPYPYLLYFPAGVYLGQIRGAVLLSGLATQVFWIVIAFLGARWMWSRGLRTYTAVGG